MLPVFVPPSFLMEIVGGSGVPNLRRFVPVGIVPPCADAVVFVVPSALAPVGGTPLSPGGMAVDYACGSH